jgi:hypothetical protein
MYRIFSRRILVIVVLVTFVYDTPQQSGALIYGGASCSVQGFCFSPDLGKKRFELTGKDDGWI